MMISHPVSNVAAFAVASAALIAVASPAGAQVAPPNAPSADDLLEPLVKPNVQVDDDLLEPLVRTEAPSDDDLLEPLVRPGSPVADDLLEPLVRPETPVDDDLLEPLVRPATPVDDDLLEPLVKPKVEFGGDLGELFGGRDKRPNSALDDTELAIRRGSEILRTRDASGVMRELEQEKLAPRVFVTRPAGGPDANAARGRPTKSGIKPAPLEIDIAEQARWEKRQKDSGGRLVLVEYPIEVNECTTVDGEAVCKRKRKMHYELHPVEPDPD